MDQVINKNGEPVNYSDVVRRMDGGAMRAAYKKGGFRNHQEFVSLYRLAHKEKFGEEFEF